MTRMLPFLDVLLILCLGLVLIPAGAHLFELPAKMAMAPEAYMATQSIYAGWALFGIPIYLSLLVLAVEAYAAGPNRMARFLFLLALALILLTQVIFWLYTFPMNALTRNWTQVPPDINAARRQWEYSHAGNALLTFAAYLAGMLGLLVRAKGWRG